MWGTVIDREPQLLCPESTTVFGATLLTGCPQPVTELGKDTREGPFLGDAGLL